MEPKTPEKKGTPAPATAPGKDAPKKPEPTKKTPPAKKEDEPKGFGVSPASQKLTAKEPAKKPAIALCEELSEVGTCKIKGDCSKKTPEARAAVGCKVSEGLPKPDPKKKPDAKNEGPGYTVNDTKNSKDPLKPKMVPANMDPAKHDYEVTFPVKIKDKTTGDQMSRPIVVVFQSVHPLYDPEVIREAFVVADKKLKVDTSQKQLPL